MSDKKNINTSTRLVCITLAVLVLAAVTDNIFWGKLSDKLFDKSALKFAIVAGALTPPVYEQPAFILSKNARLDLPNVALTEGIAMTDEELKAEQAIIAKRNKGTGGAAGGNNAVYSGAIPTGGNGAANMAAYKSVNRDTAGWLRIPGTNINYPVMRGTSYEYKQQSGASGKKPGSVWIHTGSLSSRGSMQSNTVITGHNWGNCTGAYPYIGPVTNAGRMDQLLSYTSPAFASSNPYITLTLGDGSDVTLAVIASFYVPNIYVDSACIYDGNASSLAASARSRSLIGSAASVEPGDKLVTFFTCSRYLGTGAKQRFVVVTKVL